MSDAPVALRETCRIVRGAIPLWRYHRARLESGGVDARLMRDVERMAFEAAAQIPDAEPTQRFRLSLAVTPGTDDAAQAAPAVAVKVSRELSSLDVPNGPMIARVDVDELPSLPSGAAKPADRSYWDAAMRAAKRAGAHQPVLVAADGHVVDGGTASVWAVIDGRLVTPPAPPAIAGVARAFVLDVAAASGVVSRAEPLSWEAFDSAEEQILTNAFGGVAPVRGRGGAIASVLADAFAQMWRHGA